MSDIRKNLANRFPGNSTAQEHFGDLLMAYQDSGLAPPNLRQEMATGDEQKFWACIWEAMLYRHFANLDFQFRTDLNRTSGQNGPDIGLVHKNRTIWIEAVVPKPEGLSSEWLDPSKPGEFRVRTMPHEEMLPRWTSALRDKNCRLKGRLNKNVVKPDEAYVVAINSRMLSNFPVEDYGISQMPFVVEAVFPIGPIAVRLTREGQLAGSSFHTHRHSVTKPTGVQVSTDNFLNPEYAGISAVIGCSRRDMRDGNLHLIMAHNPLAAPLPVGLLGAETEYVAQKDGPAGYLLTTVETC